MPWPSSAWLSRKSSTWPGTPAPRPRIGTQQPTVYLDIVGAPGPSIAGPLALLAVPGPVAIGCPPAEDRTGIVTAFLHVIGGASEEQAAR